MIFCKNMMDMTWCEVEDMAQKDALVLLPVGVIEEHSRHLPLGTDIYLSMDQAKDILEEMERMETPCVIAPPFYWGITSVITKCFPGSFTSKDETVKAMLHELLQSLQDAGFRRVLLLNAHGDRQHITAFILALKEFNQSHELQAKWLIFEDFAQEQGFTGKEDYILAVPVYPLEKMMQMDQEFGNSFDVHAGALETAAMYEAYPELVHMDVADTLQATELKEEDMGKWFSIDPADRDVIPDGHAGDPAFARHIKTDMKAANRQIAHDIMQIYQKL